MLLIELIALALVIGGIVVLVRYNTWAGVALIAVGVLVFLLRNAIVSGSNTSTGLGLAASSVVPLFRIRRFTL